MDLSVVVIARNEESAIGACLTSLVKQTSNRETEIILVDSASTDRTVEIASGYPVTIVRIDKCRELSPGAGRYLGTLQATGKYIFFLDGDMVLIDGWIESALAQFEDENLAAVGGSLYRVYPGEDLSYTHKNHYVLGNVRYLAGSGVYRRDVLEKVGTFNPFVKGEEERELAFRILEAGFELRRLDTPMVYHMEKRRTKSELDEKARYFTGVGQIFRHYGVRGISRDLVLAHRSIFASYLFALFVACLLATLVLAGLWLPALLVLGVGICMGTLLALLKGGNKLYLFVRSRSLIAANTIKGFGRGIPMAEGFEAATSILRPLTTGGFSGDYHGRSQERHMRGGE